jgi:hypothetical protein
VGLRYCHIGATLVDHIAYHKISNSRLMHCIKGADRVAVKPWNGLTAVVVVGLLFEVRRSYSVECSHHSVLFHM